LCTCFKSHYAAGIKTLIRYPINIGITGTVFREEKPIISLKGKKEKNYDEIDSTGSYGELSNFIFMPMYSFNNTKNGVLQFFNKKYGEPCDEDLSILKPYQKLIGMMIQNLIELNTTMDIGINMKNVLKNIEKKTALDELQEMQYQFGMNNVLKKLQNIDEIVCDKFGKRAEKFEEIYEKNIKKAE